MGNALVTSLKGIKQATAARLAQLAIHRIADLFFHFPFKYQDRTRLTPIQDLRPDQDALIEGEIIDSVILPYRRRSLQLLIKDKGGAAYIRFFYFSAAMKNAFRPGQHLRCYGTPRLGRKGMEFFHPECAFFSPANPPPLVEYLTPVYPLTEGISQVRMRKMIELALERARSEGIEDLLPTSAKDTELNDLLSISPLEALELIHNPPVGSEGLMEGVHPAQTRLALEEICAYRLALVREKQQTDNQPARRLAPCPAEWNRLRQAIPFALTEAQEACIKEIAADLGRDHQMVRLLQGDVGCGKTLVAAFAAIQAIAAGYQVALMAPTEILAEQHLAQFTQWLLPLGYEITPLLGKMSAKEKEKNSQLIAGGQTDLAIGTHSLFQEKVSFQRLALIIIDEQHRFGVKQRQRLQDKSPQLAPHQLVMTATPIPRTLAQTIFVNMDISSIRQMPPGRIPCKTLLLNNKRRNELIERINHQIKQGAQVYWVCALIEESEHLMATAAENMAEELQKALPQTRIGLVHGRLAAAEKQTIMRKFKNGEIQLLVATTVIEVGIDVPQANFMVIENAERLGLAQLHQLRGRVGRGKAESYCFLLFNPPLSEIAEKRLGFMRDCPNGFEIAEKDLELRGSGELLGIRQSGGLQWRIADIARHREVIQYVKPLTAELCAMPTAKQEQLVRRWFRDKDIYGRV